MNGLVALAGQCMPHLVLAPIALPLATGALLLLLGEERERLKLLIGTASTLAGLLLASVLLLWTHQGASASLTVYLPGNWPAPFGIALVLDRLSALMLATCATVALASSVFAAARWHRAGVRYHSLFQFQLMGLAGAFLTGDLFNLFVFFEILLAASYGLLLHGSGRARVQSGLHYIALNLAASSLFLIGAAVLYGITGTLNMADLARLVPQVAAGDRGLLHAGAALLAAAFLVKAAAWPLNLWLVPAYGAATAPVGALFSVLTKVGVYALLRLWTLWFGDAAGASAHWGGPWLVGIGLATMALAALGMLGTQRLTHLAGHAAVLSSGTLLAVMGFGQPGATAGLLYYLPGSTLAVAALFLLADLIERWQSEGSSRAAGGRDDVPFLTPELLPTEGWNLDDDEHVLVGRVIQGAAAFLGLGFMLTALILSGLPPLSGFVGKFAMLGALLADGARNGMAGAAWLTLALMLGTGLAALVALSRAGARNFWAAHAHAAPRLRILEGLPVAALLAACAAWTVYAEPALRYTTAAAQALHAPAPYIDAVMQAPPRPAPGAPALAPQEQRP